MTRQRIVVYNVPDFKDARGLWVRTYSPRVMERHTTISGALWDGIRTRCLRGGAMQRAEPTYEGCNNLFKDFQVFTDWNIHQIGYDTFDLKGRRWQFDKDLLFKGNKVYSEETCVFVPSELNSVLSKRQRFRGDLPVGVCLHKQTGKYIARVAKRFPITEHIGLYSTPLAAFEAYKRVKEAYIKELTSKWEGIIDPRAYAALMSYQVEITD